MITKLISDIISSISFMEQYKALLMKNAGSQFLNQINLYSYAEFDIKYLLKCADILSFSSEMPDLDKALRICQEVISEPKYSEKFRDKALYILKKLGNYPLISLANSKGFLDDKYESENIGIDEYFLINKINLEHTNFLPNGESFTVNSFQNSFWNKSIVNNVVSVSAPTAAGKSYIFCQKLLQIMLRSESVNVLYLVPTRALVSQVSEDVKSILNKNLVGYEVVTLPNHEFLDESIKKVFVFTQERLHFLLSRKEVEFDYIFVDEAHKLSDSYRGVLLQHAIIRASNNKSKIIYASPFSKNPEKLLELHLDKDNKDSVYDAVATVNQNLFWVNQKPKRPKDWNIQHISKDVLDIGDFQLEETPNTELKRLSFVAQKLGGRNKGNLVYVNIPSDAEKACSLIVSLKINDGEVKVESQEINDLIELCEKTIHKKFLLCKYLRYGVAFHYGNLPQVVRSKVEELFKLGHIQYLVCTSTLIEGVNLSCKNIFIRGPRKGRGKNMAMTSEDFWNLAGRAGRWGQEFQGNIFCIDVLKKDVWKNGPPKERTPYNIKPSVEKELNKIDDFISYLDRGMPRKEAFENINFEYLYSYLIEEVFSKKLSISDTLVLPEDKERLMEAVLSILMERELPIEIYRNNPGISPIAMDDLYNYFVQKMERGELETLIPPHPASADPVLDLTKILSRINKYLSNNAFGFKSSTTYVLSLLITKWMNGYSVSRLISDREKYLYNKNEDIKINSLIRSVLDDIENIARFRAPKYLACYNDILKCLLERFNKEDLVEHLGDVQLSLEFGVNSKTQLSLISLGLSRASTIEVSNYIVKSDLSKKDVLNWLKTQDLSEFDLPNLVLKEVYDLLKNLNNVQ